MLRRGLSERSGITALQAVLFRQLIYPRLRLGLRDIGRLGQASANGWHRLAPDPSVPDPLVGMGIGV